MIQGLVLVLLIVLLLVALLTAHETSITKKGQVTEPIKRLNIEPKNARKETVLRTAPQEKVIRSAPQETAPKTAIQITVPARVDNVRTALLLPVEKSDTVITAELGPPLSGTPGSNLSAENRTASPRFISNTNLKEKHEAYPLTNRRHHSRHRTKDEIRRRPTTRVN